MLSSQKLGLLRAYRFHRFKQTITANFEFKHLAFQRDHPELMAGMKRTSLCDEATSRADGTSSSDKHAEIAAMGIRIKMLKEQVIEQYRTIILYECDLVLLLSQAGEDLPDKVPRTEPNASLADTFIANGIIMGEQEFDSLDVLMEDEGDWTLYATEGQHGEQSDQRLRGRSEGANQDHHPARATPHLSPPIQAHQATHQT